MSNNTATASKDSYDISVLIEQTRMMAAEYREATGQALPVTIELACFDAVDKLQLKKLHDSEFVNAENEDGSEKYLIKGRVIFKAGKARQKLGQLSLEEPWNHLLMVIYDAQYQVKEIYKVSRDIIEQELENTPSDKRGSMTVAKYKAIGQLVWSIEDN